jgi:hypothetical protein
VSHSRPQEREKDVEADASRSTPTVRKLNPLRSRIGGRENNVYHKPGQL